MRQQDNRREVLKQMLAGTITTAEACKQLEAEKPFCLFSAMWNFTDGDREFLNTFFGGMNPLKAEYQKWISAKS